MLVSFYSKNWQTLHDKDGVICLSLAYIVIKQYHLPPFTLPNPLPYFPIVYIALTNDAIAVTVSFPFFFECYLFWLLILFLLLPTTVHTHHPDPLKHTALVGMNSRGMGRKMEHQTWPIAFNKSDLALVWPSRTITLPLLLLLFLLFVPYHHHQASVETYTSWHHSFRRRETNIRNELDKIANWCHLVTMANMMAKSQVLSPLWKG